jgi:hypothetical protein
MMHSTTPRPSPGLVPLSALALALILMAPGEGWGQTTDTATHDVTITVSEIAKLRIEGAAAPSFTINDTGITAGAPPAISTDVADRYLQYTSVIASGQTRKITAELGAAVPNGLTLNLKAAAAIQTGAVGNTGSRVSDTIALTTTAADVITGIGSGYTETGESNGWKFNYELLIANIANVVETNPTITVTYTLTAGAGES